MDGERLSLLGDSERSERCHDVFQRPTPGVEGCTPGWSDDGDALRLVDAVWEVPDREGDRGGEAEARRDEGFAWRELSEKK